VKFLRIPEVTGYIAAGILVGPHVFGWVTHDNLETLAVFSEVALGLILFSIGSVFEFSRMRSSGRVMASITVIESALAASLVTGGMLLVGQPWPVALLLGAIAIETAAASTLPFDTSLIHMSGHDANLIAAIKKYQGSKKKANLVVDGWVGVKTELVLALEGAIRIPDPDPTGPPIIPGAQGVTIWLDRLEDDLEFAKLPVILPYKMDTNVDDKTIFRKFITKMQLETLDDEYFDWRTAKDYPQSGQGG
jgi:Sodium/hydrogen exchanger family